MAVNFLQLVKPSDFNLNNQLFWDSPLQDTTMEVVARNVVFVSLKNGDNWDSFSLDDYKSRCGHSVKRVEEGILDALVKQGVLEYAHGKHYRVTNQFFGTFFKYIKTY